MEWMDGKGEESFGREMGGKGRGSHGAVSMRPLTLCTSQPWGPVLLNASSAAQVQNAALIWDLKRRIHFAWWEVFKRFHASYLGFFRSLWAYTVHGAVWDTSSLRDQRKEHQGIPWHRELSDQFYPSVVWYVHNAVVCKAEVAIRGCVTWPVWYRPHNFTLQWDESFLLFM